MTPLIEASKAVQKYGTTSLMIGAILWLNNRLSDVEDKLYHCYEQARIEALRRADSDAKINEMPLLAILPECKIRRTSERKIKNI